MNHDFFAVSAEGTLDAWLPLYIWPKDVVMFTDYMSERFGDGKSQTPSQDTASSRANRAAGPTVRSSARFSVTTRAAYTAPGRSPDTFARVAPPSYRVFHTSAAPPPSSSWVSSTAAAVSVDAPTAAAFSSVSSTAAIKRGLFQPEGANVARRPACVYRAVQLPHPRQRK